MLRPQSAIYKIDGTAIPEPTSASVSVNPLHGEASGRTDDGMMHTELIHLGKRKVELQYDFIDKTQLTDLLQKMMKQYYSFTYLDPIDGVKTIQCYGTPFSSEPDVGVYYNNLWRNVSVSCIER